MDGNCGLPTGSNELARDKPLHLTAGLTEIQIINHWQKDVSLCSEQTFLNPQDFSCLYFPQFLLWDQQALRRECLYTLNLEITNRPLIILIYLDIRELNLLRYMSVYVDFVATCGQWILSLYCHDTSFNSWSLWLTYLHLWLLPFVPQFSILWFCKLAKGVSNYSHPAGRELGFANTYTECLEGQKGID